MPPFLESSLALSHVGGGADLVAHPEACRSHRLYRPEWETKLLDLSRVYAYLAQGRWLRQVSQVGTVAFGQRIYGLGRAWAEESVESTFDPMSIHLIFHSADGERTKRFPPQGITIADLMGEMGPLANLDQFQLALPFTWDERSKCGQNAIQVQAWW